MALVEMKKVELVLHRSVIDKVVARLQHLGCCEIIRSGGEMSGDPAVGPVSEHLKRYDNLLSDARFALRFLEGYRQGKVGFLAKALAGKPKRLIADLEAESDEKAFQALVKHLYNLEKQSLEIRSELSILSGTQTTLEHFQDLPHSLSFFTKGTGQVKGVLGTIPVEQVPRLELGFSSQVGKDGELFVKISDSAKEKEAFVALIYLADLEEKVSALTADISFNLMELPEELSGTPVEESARIAERKSALQAEENSLNGEAAQLSGQWLGHVQALSDLWTVMKGRFETLQSSDSTEQIVFLRFWAPSNALPAIERELEPYSVLSEKTIKAPEKGERVPSMLVNPSWASPCEPLTNMFGVPTYGGVDPTVMMAPFFYLFFGMCLGDAGYGIILALIFGGVLLKYPIAGNLRKFLVVLFICSLSTIVMGALTGSWLSNTIDSYSPLFFLKPFRDRLVVWDPMNDPMTYLGVCLALGFGQMMFGLGIAFWDALKRRSYMEAFADRGGWIVMLFGLALFFLVEIGKAPVELGFLSKALAAAGAVVLLLTQGRSKKGILGKAISGALSLYGVTSYLGDTLSYSRLLALGLSGAAIGLIVNLLAKMIAEGVPYVGWILAALLFVVGTVFSIAINVLGAFVHSLRLQYVEFFSKFYEANGKIFTPLKYETQFVDIVEPCDSCDRS